MNFLTAAAREVNRTSGRGVIAFQGARTDRLVSSWFGANVSADFELRPDLKFIRGRSRQVARDNPWMHGMLHTQRANIFGPKGIIPQVRLRIGGKWWDASAPLDKEANKAVESFWRIWCDDPDSVSIDGLADWASQAWFAEQTRFVDGEHFEFTHIGAANDFGFALQSLDPDQLDEGFNVPRLDNGNQIRMGIEIDPRTGRRVAFHFWDQHPNDLMGGVKVRKRIPAEHIIHLYEGHRRTALRGVPSITAAILRLHMMGKHEEAELVASIAASAKMGFLSNKDGYTDEDEIELDEEGRVKPSKPVELSMEPGQIPQLPVGYEFQAWDPQHPTSAFEAFQRSMLRAIGASVGMSYASLSGDLTAVNYSSIRAGLLTERDVYRIKQTFLAGQYHRRVFRHVMQMAALKGILPIPDERLPELFRSVTWQGRGWKWVDPVNDMQALQLGIKLGVMNRSDAIAETGGDFEENLEVLRMEEELARQVGVSIAGEDSQGSALRLAPRNDAPPSKNQKTDEEDS